MTGVGAVTAAGDALETYLAARTGLSRFAEVGADRTGEPRIAAALPAPAVGMRAPGSPDAAELAIAAAVAVARLEASARVWACVIAPSQARPDAKDWLGLEWAGAIAKAIGKVASVDPPVVVQAGAAGLGEALLAAAEALNSGRAHAALIVSQDSLLRLSVLRWLDGLLRLKTDMNIDGLIPGEAAACLILEDAGRAASRGAPAYAVFRGVGVAHEPGHWLSDDVCLASGATAAHQDASASAQIEPRFPILLSDLSGDSQRAKELANAEIRTLAAAPLEHFHPADCYGDCGASAGVLLAALATAGLARCEWPAPLLIALASEGPARTSLILSPSDRSAGPITAWRPPVRHDHPMREGITALSRSLAAEHAEEAAFDSSQRARACDGSPRRLAWISQLDRRLAWHLEGTGLHAAEIWPALAAAAPDGQGEAFVAWSLALASGKLDWLAGDGLAAADGPDSARGVEAALGWAEWPLVQPLVDRLAGVDRGPGRRVLAWASLRHRRRAFNPTAADIDSPDRMLRLAALKLVGALRLRGLLREASDLGDDQTRFVRATAAALAAEPWGGAALRSMCVAAPPLGDAAADLAARTLPADQARAWLDSLRSSPGAARRAVVVAGALGDPSLCPWLLEQLQDPALARIAAESFARITGADIDVDRLAGNPMPAPAPVLPADPEAAEPPDDPDDNLPWPDAAAVQRWWDLWRDKLPAGRLFLGRTRDAESYRAALRGARQRHRELAAWELAMLRFGEPTFDTSAPVPRQLSLLT